MTNPTPQSAAARWLWAAGGPRLFGPDGVEYHLADALERVEVERLLSLCELDAVRIECGAGIADWVDAADAQRLWLEVERDFHDVAGWRPPPGARGSLPYEAQLRRAGDGRHVIVFLNE